MNYAVFSDDMQNVLRKMIGKTFKSYECKKTDTNCVYGIVRLNMGTFSIDLTNNTHSTPFFGEFVNEDISSFACELMDMKSPFFPYEENGIAHQYMIDERVKAVEIVRDRITVKNENYEILMDQALVIHTNCNVYSFYRDWIFGETIMIAVSKNEMMVPEINEVKNDWAENKDEVDIIRNTIAL